MNSNKQKRLKASGWSIGNAEDFLNDIFGKNPCNEIVLPENYDCDLTFYHNVYYLVADDKRFLSFSKEKNYYFADNRNHETIYLINLKKEKETLLLYRNIAGVFLNVIMTNVDIRDL